MPTRQSSFPSPSRSEHAGLECATALRFAGGCAQLRRQTLRPIVAAYTYNLDLGYIAVGRPSRGTARWWLLSRLEQATNMKRASLALLCGAAAAGSAAAASVVELTASTFEHDTQASTGPHRPAPSAAPALPVGPPPFHCHVCNARSNPTPSPPGPARAGVQARRLETGSSSFTPRGAAIASTSRRRGMSSQRPSMAALT